MAKLIIDEWVIREVINTLQMANNTLLGITGLDSPQEVAKKEEKECAINRAIRRAIDILQQGERSELPSTNYPLSAVLEEEELPSDVEEAANAYAESNGFVKFDDCEHYIGDDLELAFKAGAEYERGKIITEIKNQVERWMPDNPEGDEYLSGERVAFRSVLHLLKEKEEQK